MALLRGPSKPLSRWGVYDLEWRPSRLREKDPSAAVRIVGTIATDGAFRSFDTLAAGVEYMLSASDRMWWFAHAGGLYDIVFLARYIAKCTNYRVEAAFSGSSAVAFSVSRPGSLAAKTIVAEIASRALTFTRPIASSPTPPRTAPVAIATRSSP